METDLVDLSEERAKTGHPHSLWQRIIRVPHTNPEQERLAHLVATISSVVTVGLLAGAIGLLLGSGFSSGYISFIVLIGIFLTIYVLNRQGNYWAAALVLIGIFALAPFATLMRTDKNVAFQDFTAMIASISVLLTGVLFPRRNWGPVTAVSATLLYLVLPILRPAYSYADIIYPLIGLAAVSLAIVLYENQSAGLEKQRQTSFEAANAALQASEAALKQANAKHEQRIKENTLELEALADAKEQRAKLEAANAALQASEAALKEVNARLEQDVKDSALELKALADAKEQRAKLEASEAALKQANAKMEQDLKDSAIELEAVVDEYERTRVDLEKAWEEAERANRVKSAFLASVSHELRTPLNAIINFSKFVVRGVVGPVNDRQTEMLNNVISSGQHLLNLINDVLDMSKIESGSLNLFVENDVDLNAICVDALAVAQSLIGDKQVEIRSDVAPDLPRLLGDKQRIFQILLNVLSNACKFTQAGYIALSAKQEAEEILISVRDTGPGIPEADWKLIFEPFQQTETGIRQGQGTGLGMPISKNLAELHGGRIWLDSIPGEGTTFFVALPIKSSVLSVTSEQ